MPVLELMVVVAAAKVLTVERMVVVAAGKVLAVELMVVVAAGKVFTVELMVAVAVGEEAVESTVGTEVVGICCRFAANCSVPVLRF